MSNNKREVLLLFLLIISVVILANLYLKIPEIEKKLIDNMRDDSIRSLSTTIENFDRHLKHELNKLPNLTPIEAIKSDKSLQEHLESELNMMISTDIIYAYMLYRDDKGKFRFMIDGATEDKVRIGRKFDIQDDGWHKAYEQLIPQLIVQQDLSELWLTYITPVVYKNSAIGLIAVDLSFEHHKQHLLTIAPLKQMLFLVFGLILTIIIVAIVQYALYYFSQKRVYIDGLTGLKNRQYLNDLLPKINFQKYYIAMLDIDHFKNINDSYGHDVGDEVLREIATALDQGIRTEDILVRYGGEEFLLFVSSRNVSHELALSIMERLRNKVEVLEITAQSMTIKPTISIGVNLDTFELKSVNEAIKVADQMLYEAKNNGRNRVMHYSCRSVPLPSENIMLNVHEVKEAIEDKRIFFEYQPIIDLNSGFVYKHEALVRIKSEDGKTLYPGHFLENIKNSQVYKEMTLFMLQYNSERAMQEQLKVSVNLNITDLIDDDIFKQMISVFEENPELTQYITFELLEEEKIDNIDLLRKRIDIIHSFGGQIAIDDFGSGYSNFSHILQLDVDIIKIDGSLIKNIDKSELSLQLVKAIVAFATSSNKTVVAEFIHTKVIMDIVKGLGIPYGQGFYLGKPSIEPMVESVKL